MSSEDANVVILRFPNGRPSDYPFDAQVEVPAHVGRVSQLNRRVDEAITSWVQHNDWRVGSVIYSTEVDEDGVRRRIGRFKVLGVS